MMWMMREKRMEQSQGGMETLIGQGCRIEGNVVFQGGLRVDGQIVGDVRAEPEGSGYLVVPPQGRIEGEVRAARIVVSGAVVGNLHASDRVELLARASIIGNVYYASLTMQAGCHVIGKLSPADAPNSPEDRAALAAAAGAQGYNLKLLIQKAGAFT